MPPRKKARRAQPKPKPKSGSDSDSNNALNYRMPPRKRAKKAEPKPEPSSDSNNASASGITSESGILKQPVVEDATKSIAADSENIKILVGLSEKPFSVPESALRGASPFFEAALGGNWKESQDRVIKLPEDDPEPFSILSHWLHFKTIPGFENVDLDAPDEEEILREVDFDLAEGVETWTGLARAYLLGDKLLCQSFQNDINGCYIKMICRIYLDLARWDFRHEATNIIYEGTRPSDPMRRLAVNTFMSMDRDQRRVEIQCPCLPREFLEDAMDKSCEFSGGMKEATDFCDEESRNAINSFVEMEAGERRRKLSDPSLRRESLIDLLDKLYEYHDNLLCDEIGKKKDYCR